jgi:porin
MFRNISMSWTTPQRLPRVANRSAELEFLAGLDNAPQATRSVTSYASVALVAHGLINGREHDSFGAGFYYNRINNNPKTDIAQLTLGNVSVNDASGIEVFYNFEVTPAIQLIPSYQHIWQLLAAQVAKGQITPISF